MVNLAICILFYEKVDQTIKCIKSFLPSGVRIYILNNASSSSSRETLGKYCKRYEQITIFDSPENLGVSKGRNYLINNTTEEWLFFVDNDIYVKTKDWPDRFRKYLKKHPDTEVFVPRLWQAHDKIFHTHSVMRIEGRRAYHDGVVDGNNSNAFPGGASLVRRGLFERLGSYDEEMFVGFEDYEYSIRGIISGDQIRVRLIDDIELVHEHLKVNSQNDRKAVNVRYDVDRISHAHKHIFEKHGINLYTDWKPWVNEQKEIQLGTGADRKIKKLGSKAKKKIKSVVPRPIKSKLKTVYKIVAGEFPTNATLFMSDRCNYACPGCRRSMVGIHESKEMTIEMVKLIQEKYPSIKSFTIAGLGEPTLCESFVEIVEHLKNSGKAVGIITNGSNAEKLTALTIDPDYISISLNGYNDETHFHETGVACFNNVIETFQKLKKQFSNVGFSFIVKKTNFWNLGNVIRLCDDIMPDFLDLLNYLVYDPKRRDEICKVVTTNDLEIIEYVMIQCENKPYIRHSPVYVDFKNEKFSCECYSYHINFDGAGNIGGCMRQIPPDERYGNILRDRDPYNSKEMRLLREKQETMKKTKKTPHEECHVCFGNWKDER